MRFSLIAAALAATSLSFVVSPAFAMPLPQSPAAESRQEPKLDLGIDIGQAGGTSGSVKAFVANLALDAQASVRGGCQTVMKYPAGNQPDTISFCTLLSQ